MFSLPDQVISSSFLVKNEDGVLVNSDTLPTAVLYRNGNSTTTSVAVASITGTGKYRFNATLPGYDVGDQIQMEVTATVGGSPFTSIVWSSTVLDLSFGDIDGKNLEESLKIMLAALAGKLSGVSGAGTITFRSIDDAEDRIVADVDGQGNRSNVTTNP